jgi:hypothetical protein
MKEQFAFWLPWLMSAITIYTMVLAGNKDTKAWVIGLVNQILWATFIWLTAAWGLIPMNIAMVIVYYRNATKWHREHRLEMNQIA